MFSNTSRSDLSHTSADPQFMFQSKPKRWKWPFMEIKRESLKDGWGEVGSLLITGRRGGFGLFWWGWLSQLGRLDVRKLPDGESDIPKHFSCKALTCWAPFTFGGERIILFNLFLIVGNFFVRNILLPVLLSQESYPVCHRRRFHRCEHLTLAW